MIVLASLNPLSYAVDGMRSLVVGPGIHWSFLATESVILLGFDVLLLWVGVRALRRVVA